MNRPLPSRHLTALLLAAIAVTFTAAGFGCKNQVDPAVAKMIEPVTLNYWRVFDGSDAFAPIIAKYTALHPNVTINYRLLSYDEYERTILSAMAEGKGPDLLNLQATWMSQWQPYLAAAPAAITMPQRVVTTSALGTDITYTVSEVAGPTPKSVKNDFVDGVYDDVVLLTAQTKPELPPVPQVYGLPLATDSLALYYNRDLLDNAGISQPANDWKTFQEHVKKLTRLDETGAIIQSGTALGTADNVERAADIVSLLMMQNGAHMTENGQATFDKTPAEMAGRPLPPGAEALTFYTDFANPEKEVYAWNDKMPNSLKAFTEGHTAYFFGYSYHLASIRALAPKLNFGIAPFPQIAGNNPVNFANYWVEAVTKQAQHQNEAWDFLTFLTNDENSALYLKSTRKPTARRALVNSQLDDLDLAVFAAQAPSAKSWYHGMDARATEQSFLDMIRQMLSREADPKHLVELTATKVNQTIK
jgi:ABC-type glycerol-3-phosphate transport system substrate-binding protein